MMRTLLLLLLGATFGYAQLVGTARMLEQAGQTERAWTEYGRVLEREPRDLAAYRGYRLLSGRLDAYDSLLVMSERLVALDANQIEYAQGRIEALIGLGRKAEAMDACRVTARRWPTQTMYLVDLLDRANELKAATEYLVRLRSRYGDALLHGARLVDLYERQRRYREAVREIAAIVRRQPDVLSGFLDKLREYAVRTDYRGLLAELRTLDDGWTRARAEAEVLIGAGREADALNVARKGMKRDELYGLAHEAEAVGALQLALAVYREQGLHADQARVLRRQGKLADALQALRQDGSAAARFELGQVQRLEQHDYQAAVGSYEAVLDREPGNRDAVYGLARALLALGRTKPARAALNQLGNPADSVLLLLARLHFYEGELDSARRYVALLTRGHSGSTLINDGLTLALLTRVGTGAGELAQAMLAAETGDTAQALAGARKLKTGSGSVVEEAYFLEVRVLREQAQPKQALAVLDSLVVRFPDSPNHPRALYVKAGVLLDDIRDENLWRRVLEELVVGHPGSSYAVVARAMLEESNRPVEPDGIR